MKTLYIRLAAEGIRRNRRFYLPFLLTAAGVGAVQYILFFLAGDVGLDKISGGATLRVILQLGSFVIAVFAALFLFYTHAFLTRRRGREFGLYSVLGMGKRSLAAILFWETLLSVAVSLSVGLLTGAALAKLAELGLYRITGGTVNYSLRLSGAGLGETTLVFGVIFLLLFLDSLRRIGFADTVTLTKSENLGEKPPRANPVLGVLGLLLILGAYALAITIQDPIAAIGLFFLAVLMVIVGTYLVFIAGSVLLCRLLQRNKRYYYKPAHFVSVSSMAFRMKQNGAGLASVCILATMVLVMISSTTCLYFGEEDVVRTRYPEDMRVEFVFWDDETTDASARIPTLCAHLCLPRRRTLASSRRIFRRTLPFIRKAATRAISAPLTRRRTTTRRPRSGARCCVGSGRMKQKNSTAMRDSSATAARLRVETSTARSAVCSSSAFCCRRSLSVPPC